MASTWIVSANASRARFFSQENLTGPLQEINDMINDDVRQRTMENIESDKLGPTSATKSMHNVGGSTPNKTYQPNQTPEQHLTEQFARDVVAYLEKGQQDGKFQQLCLVSSPEFLGVLRGLLSNNLKPLVKQEIIKDYTRLSANELQEHLRSGSEKA